MGGGKGQKAQSFVLMVQPIKNFCIIEAHMVLILLCGIFSFETVPSGLLFLFWLIIEALQFVRMCLL